MFGFVRAAIAGIREAVRSTGERVSENAGSAAPGTSGAKLHTGSEAARNPKLPPKSVPKVVIGNPGKWSEAITAAGLYSAMYPGIKGPNERFVDALRGDPRAFNTFVATAHETKDHLETFALVLRDLASAFTDEQLAVVAANFGKIGLGRGYDHERRESGFDVLRATVKRENVRRNPPETMGLRSPTLEEIAALAIAHVDGGGTIEAGQSKGLWLKDGETRWSSRRHSAYVPAGEVVLQPRDGDDVFLVLTKGEPIGGDRGKIDVVELGAQKTLVLGPDIQAAIRKTRPELAPELG